MIRPLTLLCASAFVFSGFHLYQTKHRAQETDRAIVRTMKDVARAHDHAVLLRAEYALLNDPTRLQDLAQQYLALRPTAPTQFVAMADIASRLPAVGPSPNAAPPVELPPVAAPAIADIPMASATPAPLAAPAMVAEAPPRPAVPHAAPVHVAAAHPVEARPVEARPVEARPAGVEVAANRPLEGAVRSVALVRPLPRRSEPAPAPTPLHAAATPVRQLPYVAPFRPAAQEPSRAPAYARPAPVQARYTPPSYSGTPFAEPRYAAAPARPIGGSVLGMAYTSGAYSTGAGR